MAAGFAGVEEIEGVVFERRITTVGAAPVEGVRVAARDEGFGPALPAQRIPTEGQLRFGETVVAGRVEFAVQVGVVGAEHAQVQTGIGRIDYGAFQTVELLSR